MNFVQEKIDSQNALLKVTLQPEDYLPKVEAALKNVQKRASMPGFRAGKIPVGLVRKMYGKSVLIDEINKVLNDSIHNYLTENKLNILGQPLPKTEGQPEIDWDNQRIFEFTYEMGLSPEIDVDLEGAGSFDFKSVMISPEMVEEEVTDMKKRYGNVTNPDVTEAGDRLFGDFNELDETGEIKAGGIFKSGSFMLDTVADADLKQLFTGISRGQQTTFNPSKLSNNPTDLASLLGITRQQAEELTSQFKFTLQNISRVSPAEENSEFYNKIYGESIQTSEEFREKVKNEISAMFNRDSERMFINSVIKHFVELNEINLPETFLKRWLKAVSEKPVTSEQLDGEFPSYAERLKNQLVINKIIEKYELKVSTEEIENYVRQIIKNQFASYNSGIEMEEEDLKATVERVLKNEKEYERIVEMIYDQKISALLKEKLTLNNREVPVEEFYKG